MKTASLTTISKKSFAIAATAALLFFAVTKTAAADTYGCTPSYGGYGSCAPSEVTVSLNKTVQNPSTKAYVDNLTINDAKYRPESTVQFNITVTNNQDQLLTNVEVKDILPPFVTYIAGAGSYDSKTNTLTFTTDLQPNQSRTFAISAKVANSANLPTNQGITCVTNQSFATSEGYSVQDNAQFCIENPTLGTKTKGGFPTTKGGQKVYPTPKVKKTPSTGPEVVALVGLVPAMFVGLKLRKQAAK